MDEALASLLPPSVPLSLPPSHPTSHSRLHSRSCSRSRYLAHFQTCSLLSCVRVGALCLFIIVSRLLSRLFSLSLSLPPPLLSSAATKVDHKFFNPEIQFCLSRPQFALCLCRVGERDSVCRSYQILRFDSDDRVVEHL